MKIGIVLFASGLGLQSLAALQNPTPRTAPQPRKTAVGPGKATGKPGLAPLILRAEQGDLAACEKLAAAYEKGAGAPMDLLKAATYYQRAGMGGSVLSCLKFLEIKRANPDFPLSQGIREESGPGRIDFIAASPRCAPGDRWMYRLTSGDDSMNGKTLEITCLERKGDRWVFSTDLAGTTNRFEIQADAKVKYFRPKTQSNGSIAFEAMASYPEILEKGSVWSVREGRKGIIRGGRLVGWEPSPVHTAALGDYRLSPNGRVPTCRLRTSFDEILQHELDLSPDFAFPLNFMTRAEGGKWVWGELAAAGTPDLKPTPDSLAPECRLKLVSWLKANIDPTSITFTVCMSLMVGGVQQDPNRTIMVVGGKGLTISGKAFYLLKTPTGFTLGDFTDEEAERYGIAANIVKSMQI